MPGRRRMRGSGVLSKLKSAGSALNKFAKDTKLLSTGLKLASNAGYGGMGTAVGGNIAGQLGYGKRRPRRRGAGKAKSMRMRPAF
jgi:hypothetical protein